jgi:hypothetical protein
MDNIFFNIGTITFEQLIEKLFLFILISGFLLYIIYFTLTKFLYKKNVLRKEIQIRLSFLWSLVIFNIIFNSYLYLFFYFNGLYDFNWMVLTFYLGISAQLFIYIGIIIFYFIKRNTLNKLINEKSIN